MKRMKTTFFNTVLYVFLTLNVKAQINRLR
jgi:hypothetical protein